MEHIPGKDITPGRMSWVFSSHNNTVFKLSGKKHKKYHFQDAEKYALPNTGPL